MDDPFVTCPYNSSHRVPRSRIQSHLVRCKEKNPNFVICPYNATHRLPESEIKGHVVNCPSKDAIFPNETTVQIKPDEVKLKRPPMDEEDMWDD
ncbi:unnamed protein product, partial [Brenthis ino]